MVTPVLLCCGSGTRIRPLSRCYKWFNVDFHAELVNRLAKLTSDVGSPFFKRRPCVLQTDQQTEWICLSRQGLKLRGEKLEINYLQSE